MSNVNKKGINGIVVTILLILFIVAASGVVFNWIKEQTSGVMEQSTVISEKLQVCREPRINFEKAYCSPESEGIIKVKVANNKNEDIKEGISIRLIENGEVGATISSVIDIELKAYEGKEITIFKQQEEGSLDTIFKPVDKIEFIPKFVIGKKTVYCSDNKIILDAENCW